MNNLNKKRTELLTLAVDPSVPESRIVTAVHMMKEERGSEESKKPVRNFMTVHGMMEYLTVSRTQLWKMRRAGLPHFRVGTKIIFKPESVEDWLIKNQKRGI